jgi:hypothetical protein
MSKSILLVSFSLSASRHSHPPPATRYSLLLLASSNLSKYFFATASQLRSASIFSGGFADYD